MNTHGNRNTLERASLAGTTRLAAPGAVARTQLVREQRWAALTVQEFAEPDCLALVQLPPPSELRLMALVSGTLRMRVRGRGRELAYTSQPGTVRITGPHYQPYEMEWQALTDSPVRTVHLYLPPDLLPRTAEAAGLNAARVELAEGCAIADPLLNQLTIALTQTAPQAMLPDALFAETAVQLLAAQLLRQHCTLRHELPASRGALPPERLRQLRDYVQAHLADAIRLEDLAALAHLSSYHFCRVFKRTTGRTPNQFVTEQRVARAGELLRHSRLSVKQVAFAVGYASPAHFTQLFVRHTGQLPQHLVQKRGR